MSDDELKLRILSGSFARLDDGEIANSANKCARELDMRDVFRELDTDETVRSDVEAPIRC